MKLSPISWGLPATSVANNSQKKTTPQKLTSSFLKSVKKCNTNLGEAYIRQSLSELFKRSSNKKNKGCLTPIINLLQGNSVKSIRDLAILVKKELQHQKYKHSLKKDFTLIVTSLDTLIFGENIPKKAKIIKPVVTDTVVSNKVSSLGADENEQSSIFKPEIIKKEIENIYKEMPFLKSKKPLDEMQIRQVKIYIAKKFKSFPELEEMKNTTKEQEVFDAKATCLFAVTKTVENAWLNLKIIPESDAIKILKGLRTITLFPFVYERKRETAPFKTVKDKEIPFVTVNGKNIYFTNHSLDGTSVLGAGSYGKLRIAQKEGKELANKKEYITDVYRLLNKYREWKLVKKIEKALQEKKDKLSNHFVKSYTVCQYFDGKIKHKNSGFRYEVKVSEFMEKLDMNLFDLAKKEMNKAELFAYVKQVASFLAFLHEYMRICHNDIKLENILLDLKTKTAKLADFGISFEIDHLQDWLDNGIMDKLTLGGSSGSPETENPVDINNINQSVDIYALGKMLCQIAFDVDILKRQEELTLNLGKLLTSDSKKDQLLADLIFKCFEVNPSERITIREFLGHPFISNIDIIQQKNNEL